jgi:DNA repair exonuclease SbcCD nuclease subunit
MKIASSADLHAHNFKDFDEISDRTGSKRLDYLVDTLGTMKEYCVSNQVSYFILAGDLFNIRGKINILVYNAMYDQIKLFGEAGITVILVAGNHDDYDNSDIPETALHAFKDLNNVIVFQSNGSYDIEGTDITLDCVPFTKNKESILNYINSCENDGRSHILVTHLGVSGASVGQSSYPMQDAFNVGELRPDFFKYIILGHYHKHQFIAKLPHVFYCGSPIQHSFNDEGADNGFVVLDTSKRYDVQFVPIPNPRFFTVNGTVTQEELQSHADQGNYLRVQLKENEVQAFNSIIPQGLLYKMELQKEYVQETRVDVKIGMSFEDIVTTYAEEFNPKAKDTGLRILKEVGGK